MTKIKDVSPRTREKLLKYLDGEKDIWIDREGKKIYIDQLESDHLANCMRRIESDLEEYKFSETDRNLANQKLNQLKDVWKDKNKDLF